MGWQKDLSSGRLATAVGPGLGRQQDTSDTGSHPDAQPGDFHRSGSHVLLSVRITGSGSTPNTTVREVQLPATWLPDTSLTHHINNTMEQSSQPASRRAPCWCLTVSNHTSCQHEEPGGQGTLSLVTIAGSEGARQSHTPINGGICFSDSGPSGKKVK